MKVWVVLNRLGEGTFGGVFDNEEMAISRYKELFSDESELTLDDPRCEWELVKDDEGESINLQLKVPDVDEYGPDYGGERAILIVEVNDRRNIFVGG